jgi:hypothetical protein
MINSSSKLAEAGPFKVIKNPNSRSLNPFVVIQEGKPKRILVECSKYPPEPYKDPLNFALVIAAALNRCLL